MAVKKTHDTKHTFDCEMLLVFFSQLADVRETAKQVHHIGIVLNPADFGEESQVRQAMPEIDLKKMCRGCNGCPRVLGKSLPVKGCETAHLGMDVAHLVAR